MGKQNYEEYWKLTLEYTDFNDDKFRTTLAMVVEKIDELNLNGPYSYHSSDNKAIQQTIIKKLPKGAKDPLISTRKAINQCIKLGFVNPRYQSYHPNTKDYLNAKSNKRRKTLLSKIIYSNSKFNSSVTKAHNWSQINFLISTLEEVGFLSSEDIIAMMTVDISDLDKNYLTRLEIDEILKDLDPDFIERKYNQVGYLKNILRKLDEVVFVKNNGKYELYFTEDAKRIFGEDLEQESKKRNPYLHLLYKNQLFEESEEKYNNKRLCFAEKLEYPVLIASHIKPFADSNEHEAYDPNNGLLLSRTIDSLFDLKYISFTDEGTMLFSNRIPEDVKAFWQDYKLDKTILNEERKAYLTYHRNSMAALDA
ncbi:HNH endonuclease [Hyunsoonleella ulvae]|uniref:HNH endonuclease n=1 Tax=Hyunsoonleella ulvae TaxID=2799948 RepID=UPI00193A43F0|nr:HNH endonuclease [Hyunsoonleella ulvae]